MNTYTHHILEWLWCKASESEVMCDNKKHCSIILARGLALPEKVPIHFLGKTSETVQRSFVASILIQSSNSIKPNITFASLSSHSS